MLTATWVNRCTNQTGFELQHGPSNTGPWSTPVTVASTVATGATATYSFPGLSPSSTYWVRGRAVNSLNQSNWTVSTFGASPGPPLAPSNLTATPLSCTQVKLTWVDNANNENGFNVYRKNGPGGTYNWIVPPQGPMSPGTGGTVSWIEPNTLQPNKTYFYKVRAARSAAISSGV